MARRRAVVVHRRTELDELLDRHGTRGQAEFFLRARGRSLGELQQRHDAATEARSALTKAIPHEWSQAVVERADLPRFLLAPEDVVIVVGQDGLLANVAKYLSGQPVVGVDPDPGVNPGLLVPFDTARAVALVSHLDGTPPPALRTWDLTTVRATLDDGQSLVALNEVFVGHASHQSARYVVHTPDGARERQSSSGVLIATGTGATGWCASVAHDRGGRTLPTRTERTLAWFVREAWPSPATGADLTEGALADGTSLRVTVESDALVVFGDGMESDRLNASWGQEIAIGVHDVPLRLVAPPRTRFPAHLTTA